MFFKILTPLVFLSIASCSWWGGDTENNDIITFADEQLLGKTSDCVEHLGLFFDEYFKGEAEHRDVNENIACVKDVTAKIFEHANEQDIDNGFTRKEIETVLKTVFPFKNRKALNENVDLLFLVKKMFIGGRADGFSRLDKLRFDKALSFIEKQMLLSIDGVRYLFFPNEGILSVRDDAYAKMQTSFEEIDKFRADNSGALNESETLRVLSYIFNEETKLYIYKDIVLTAKRFLMGGAESFEKSEPELFTRAFSALEVQSRMRSVDFSQGFLAGESYYDLRKSFSLIGGKLKDWSVKDEKYDLSIDDVKKLVSRLHTLGVLNNLFSNVEMINQSLESFLITIFKTSVFGESAFEKLELIIRDWARRQNNIISIFNFSWATGRVDGLNKNSAVILEDIKSFNTPIFQSLPGLPIRIKRDDDELSSEEEYFDLSLKHTLYTVAVVVFEAYSLDENTEELNLKLPEVKHIFDDLRPLAVEMGFADPHSCNSENRAFIEADSLTINGNGDDTLSINEAVEWIGTMISVGSISGHMMSLVESKCSYAGLLNLGYPFMSRACVYEELFSKKTLLYNYFPNAFSYIETLKSDSKREKFQKDLDSIGGLVLGIEDGEKDSYNRFFVESSNSCGIEGFPVNRGELNSAVAIAVYIENVFFQFDQTGLKGLSDYVFSNDPQGPDEILDGNEVSMFLNGKFSSIINNFKNNTLDNYPEFKRQVEFVSRVLTDAPEAILKLDRVGAHQFIAKMTEWFLNAEPHPFSKRYCEDVYASFETAVVYRTEDRLTCLPGEGG